MIEKARWETKEEKEKRESYFTSTQEKIKNESLKWCVDNTDFLIQSHEEYYHYINTHEKEKHEENIINSYEKREQSNNHFNYLLKEIENNRPVYCACKGKLRFVEGYNFIGCSNYNDKTKYHESYNFHNLQPFDIYLEVNRFREQEIGKNYLNDFKKVFKIPKQIMPSIIFKTLQLNNIKPHAAIDEKYFTKAKDASANSKNEEQMLLKILENKFQKVSAQIGIRYFDGEKWFTKIPDYICQNDSTIFVFDAKKNYLSIDKKQLKLYEDLVKFITKEKNINKDVKSYFIIFDTEDEIIKDDSCLTFNNLINL